MPSPKCGVCGVNESKYKCPRCRSIKYCSQACFTVHAATCEQVPAPAPAPAAGPGSDGALTMANSSSEGHADALAPAAALSLSAAAAGAAAAASVPVPLRGNARITAAAASSASSQSLAQFPASSLERLRTNASVRASLRSEELQGILAALVAAPAGAQRRLLADQVEGNPRFAEFVDEMLAVVDDERARKKEEEERRKDEEFADAFFGVQRT